MVGRDEQAETAGKPVGNDPGGKRCDGGGVAPDRFEQDGARLDADFSELVFNDARIGRVADDDRGGKDAFILC